MRYFAQLSHPHSTVWDVVDRKPVDCREVVAKFCGEDAERHARAHASCLNGGESSVSVPCLTIKLELDRTGLRHAIEEVRREAECRPRPSRYRVDIAGLNGTDRNVVDTHDCDRTVAFFSGYRSSESARCIADQLNRHGEVDC